MKNWLKISKGGAGGSENKVNNHQFQFGNVENPWGFSMVVEKLVLSMSRFEVYQSRNGFFGQMKLHLLCNVFFTI